MRAHPGRIDTRDDGVSLLAFADGIMVHAQFLGNEMDDPPLLGTKSPREC
jgi:hypothetical protein